MNIKDKSSSTIWTNTTSTSLDTTANYTSPWYLSSGGGTGRFNVQDLDIQPNTSISLTSTLVDSDQPGNLTWPWWQFIATAVSLTFMSIILPLIAGPTYRSIARFSIRRRKDFRVIIIGLWLP
jgi:hypothetical protein